MRGELIAAMEAMLKSRGWEYFKVSLEKAERYVIEQLPNLSDPNKVYRALGELHQIRQQLNYPRTMLAQALAVQKTEQEKNDGQRKQR